MIRFFIAALEKSPVTLQGELPAEFLDFAEDDLFSSAGTGTYSLTGSIVSQGVLVSGSAEVHLKSFCGRCLKEFTFSLRKDDLKMFFEVDDSQDKIDVAEDLRAELLLDLPMNPCCSPDCRGLCRNCGCDLNTTQCSCSDDDLGKSAVSPWNALDSLGL